MAGVSGRIMMLAIAATSAIAFAGQEDYWKSRTFSQCYLYRDGQGVVWLCQPVVALGMVGVMDSPDVRLSPELGKRFADLITATGVGPGGYGYWDFDFAPARRGKGPVFLLKIESQTRKFEPTTQPVKKDTPSALGEMLTREIISARLLEAEVMSPGCVEAWQTLDKAIADIVEQSRTAPGPAKREQILKAVGKGTEAAWTMARMEKDDALIARVKKIEPKVSFTTEYQEHLRESWQDALEALTDVLQIKPTTKLPPISRRWLSRSVPRCPTLELLARADSPAAFTAEIKKSWPPETFEQQIPFYTRPPIRSLSVREVGELTADEFKRVQAQAQKGLENRERQLRERSESVKQKWGIALQWADPDTLADKLLLRGLVVEKVFSDGPDLGFKQWDIIIDYLRVYDVIMGGLGQGSDPRPVSMRYSQGKVDLLRDDEVITLAVPK